MRFDLAIYTVGGGEYGYGHLSRAMALAQAALDTGVRAVTVMPPEIVGLWRWPGPVAADCVGSVEADVLIFDTGAESLADLNHRMEPGIPGVRAIAIADDIPSCGLGLFDMIVYPHPGRAPGVPLAPVLMGPAYYPLRRAFQKPVEGDAVGQGPPVAYRYEHPGMDDLADASLTEWEMRERLANAHHVVFPPSVIAYEAMALGTPVLLHHGLPQYDHIGEAMVEGGLAMWADDYKEGDELKRERLVNPYGALELLRSVMP